MAQPLHLDAEQMRALAVFSILEGAPDLTHVHEQLKVAAVIVNRTNSRNWVSQYGSTIVEQLFAPGQFEVRTRYRLQVSQFKSALAAAKAGVDTRTATDRIRAFMAEAGVAERYTRAAREIGNATGFRGRNGVNRFRRESRFDDPNLAARQPSHILVRR
jgi:hypothetical protein